MAQYHCENCPICAKHDNAPKSLIGRFWRRYINFCPGWKKIHKFIGRREKNDTESKIQLEMISA